MEPQLIIGHRLCAVRVPVLTRRAVAWVMEVPEDTIRAAQRRGERLQAHGLDDDEVLSAGALPVVIVGHRRAMSPSVLARHPDVAGNPLRLDALVALVEGRIRPPRPRSSKGCDHRLADEVMRIV